MKFTRPALRNPRPVVETLGMAVPLSARPVLLQLLLDGIPPTLLLDLLDPEGMRAALASELATSEAAPERARQPLRVVRTA